jgi:hypothetical protein
MTDDEIPAYNAERKMKQKANFDEEFDKEKKLAGSAVFVTGSTCFSNQVLTESTSHENSTINSVVLGKVPREHISMCACPPEHRNINLKTMCHTMC